MTTSTTDFDVLIVGAGISGIGAAYYLSTGLPDRRFAVLEGRDAIGGTWDLFRFPGIRSDSDCHTMGFAFKPWTDKKAISEAPAILRYLREAVDENDLRRHIRFGHQVTAVRFNTEDARWTVTVEGEDRLARLTAVRAHRHT